MSEMVIPIARQERTMNMIEEQPTKDQQLTWVLKKRPLLHLVKSTHNKETLIKILSATMRKSGIRIIQVDKEADPVIVKKSVSYTTSTYENVIVNANDTDVLVILF